MHNKDKLQYIFNNVKSNIKFVLAITVIVSMIVVFASHRFKTPEYRSSIDICLISDSVDEKNISEKEINTCIHVLKARASIDKVLENMRNMNAIYAEVKFDDVDFSYENIENTKIIRISVFSNKAEFSKDVCEAYGKTVYDCVSKVGDISATIVEEPVAAKTPERMFLVKNGIIAAASTLAILIIALIVVSCKKQVVKDGKAASKKIGLTLLGEIPELLNMVEQEYEKDNSKNNNLKG